MVFAWDQDHKGGQNKFSMRVGSFHSVKLKKIKIKLKVCYIYSAKPVTHTLPALGSLYLNWRAQYSTGHSHSQWKWRPNVDVHPVQLSARRLLFTPPSPPQTAHAPPL